MKKIAGLVLALSIAGAGACARVSATDGALPTHAQHLKKISLRFPNGKKIKVEVADNPEERETGLMFRSSLPKNYGMLFAFPQQEGMEFWMKNTWVPLDIIYIGSDEAITGIQADVKASQPLTTDDQVARVWGVGQYVIEFPAGTAAREKFKVGQKFKFKTATPLQ